MKENCKNSKAILRATLAHGVLKVVNMVTNGHTNVGSSGQRPWLYVFSKFVWWQIMFSALMLQNVWVHHFTALLISILKSLKSLIWKWVLSSDFTDVYFLLSSVFPHVEACTGLFVCLCDREQISLNFCVQVFLCLGHTFALRCTCYSVFFVYKYF